MASAFFGGSSNGNNGVDENILEEYDYEYDYALDPANLYEFY